MNKEEMNVFVSNLRKRLDYIEIDMKEIEKSLDSAKKDTTIDPYLIPGAICEIWEDGIDSNFNTGLVYFSHYAHNGSALFVDDKAHIGNDSLSFDVINYKVKVTIWDFAPDWANWYSVDEDGTGYFYTLEPFIDNYKWSTHADRDNRTIQSIHNDCRVDDWKESLVQRPKWAKIKNS